MSTLHDIVPRSFAVFFCVYAASLANSCVAEEPAANRDRMLPMEVTVNGVQGGSWLLVEHEDALYAPQEAFEEWRLLLNLDTAPIQLQGQRYWPLNAIPGYRAKINLANQSVELQFSPEVFSATRLTNNTVIRPALSPVLPSLQFNYDLNYSKSYLRSMSAPEDLSALTEFGVSGNWGVLTSSAVGRNLTQDKTLGTSSQWLRLETTLTKDLPEYNNTLRLGDSSTRTGMLGNNVYFGGIQFGTNFALTPGFVHQPLPVLTGLSVAPSTVQLYINDVLRQVSDVPAGPFAVENFPILTGSGEARLVVTDQLGRQTVVEESFFMNSQLLRSGLDDWGVEAGKVRRDLGTTSANYGSEFINGIWRHGVTNNFTLEGRAVAASSLALMELGAITALPFQLLGRTAIAGSHTKNAGNGNQALLGIEYPGLRFNASLEMQGATINYRELGVDMNVLPIKQQLAGNMSYASENLGSFGMGFARIKRYDNPPVATVSANYSIQLGNRNNLSIMASRAQSGINSTVVGMTLTILLDKNRVASAYVNKSGNLTDAYATYADFPDQNNPYGWRVLTGQQQNRQHDETGASYAGKYGSLAGDVSTSRDQTALRIDTNGGLIWTEGYLFATPRISNSFALAEVKDYADIGVGIGSNMVTKTDASGIALIPNLTAYQRNSIQLDARDLPVSAELDSLEREAVPAWRSGVKITFPVRNGRGALLKIQLENGEPVPAGAIVNIEGDPQVFYVARRGETFVTGLLPVTKIHLNWKEQHCSMEITLPPQKLDEIPRLGPFLCKGVLK